MPCPRCYSTRTLEFGWDSLHFCIDCSLRYADQPRDPNGEFGVGKEAGDVPTSKTKTPKETPESDVADPTLQQPIRQGEPLQADDYAKLVAQNPDGGFSVDVRDGSSPTTGFMVAGLAPEILVDPSDPKGAGQQIAKYAKEHPEATHIVGWFDSGSGQYVVEPSENITDKFQAVITGMARNQKAIYDIDGGGDVITYGTGDHTGKNDNFYAPQLGEAIHPGSKPTGYAYSGTSVVGTTVPTNMDNTTMAGLSEGTQGAIKARADKIAGLTLEKMTANVAKVMEQATPQQIADGMAAYARYNAVAENIAHDSGITANQAAGIIASTSRQTPLGSNLAGAAYIAKIVHDDAVINLPDSVVEAAKTAKSKTGADAGADITNHVPLSQAGDLGAQARAIMLTISNDPKALTDPVWGTKKNGDPVRIHLACGDDGVENAIKIARDPSAIDTSLSGMKQRSFYNNIQNPHDPRFVTVDGFMTGIAMDADDPYAAAASKPGLALMNAPSVVAENSQSGTYPMQADAIRDASAQVSAAHGVDIIPSQGQAIAWTAGGGGSSKGTPPTPTPITRPAESIWNPDQSNPGTESKVPDSVTKQQQIANSVAAYKAPVMRDLVDSAAALSEVQKQFPDFKGQAFGVKAKDGKTVTAVFGDSQIVAVVDAHPEAVTSEDIQSVLSRAADLYDHDNLGLANAPILNLISPDVMGDMVDKSADQAASIMGMTSPEQPGLININGMTFRQTADASNGWMMPVGNVTGDDTFNATYTVTHEYGHLTMGAHDLYNNGDTHSSSSVIKNYQDPKSAANAAFIAANKVAADLGPGMGLSEYGKTNAREAYAEAFTEWTLTGGKTTNAIAKVYAEKFHWDKPDKLAPGSNAVGAITGAPDEYNVNPADDSAGTYSKDVFDKNGVNITAQQDKNAELDLAHTLDLKDDKGSGLVEPGLTSPNSLGGQQNPNKYTKQEQNPDWVPLSQAEHDANPDHSHFMVEGKEPHPTKPGQTISVIHGPFHSKDEAKDAIAEHNVTKSSIKFYPPGTLTHPNPDWERLAKAEHS